MSSPANCVSVLLLEGPSVIEIFESIVEAFEEHVKPVHA